MRPFLLRSGRMSFPRVSKKAAARKTKSAPCNMCDSPSTRQAQAAFVNGEKAELVIDHPNYRVKVALTPEVQKSLAEDLAA